MMIKHVSILIGAVLVFIALGCTQHKVEVAPVEVKPIHITIDAAEEKLEEIPSATE
jgi:hypothetical protein